MVPSSFTTLAAIYVNGSSTANYGTTNEWSVLQDADAKIHMQVYSQPCRYAPEEYLGTPASLFNITQVDTAEQSYEVIGQLCYDAPGKYVGMFDWIANATFEDNVYSNGVQSLLVNGSIPLVYNASAYTYVFYNFTEGASLTWEGCPALVECGSGTVEKELFIFHPEDNFDLAGQDWGDDLGDVFFICEDMQKNGSHFSSAYQWISHFLVTFNGTIGQYQNCIGYPSSCKGDNDFYVGKEAPLGLGHQVSGQCENNTAIGNWYSMPVGGQCASLDQLKDGSCSWFPQRLKTINGSCLFDVDDYVALCKQDQRAPFSTAALAFNAAFNSDDPTLGGCPEIVGK